MDRFGRRERLLVFNGEDRLGRPLSFAAQRKLFASASLVIGPHGEIDCPNRNFDPSQNPS